ncbi:MAG: HAMP domain-containing histidine kinase [Acidobacteriaceae bacterium]|nr:HAMP domain-containing histidine kinase [Acidobacteriaceae bacterium]
MLTVFSAGIVWLHARWSQAQFDADLSALATTVSLIMQEELDETGDLVKAAREARSSINIPDRVMAIVGPDGAPIVARWRTLAPEMLPPNTSTRPGTITVPQGDHDWRLVVMRESPAAGPYFVLVGGTLDHVEQQQQLLVHVLLLATPLMALITAGVCWWLASSALRPLTLMSEEADAITARAPERRLSTAMTTDELGRVARAFNRLLDRLSSALQTQRRFMAAASHDLRTPVSVIQTAAEVILERPVREHGEYREALTIIRDQSARLSRMVQDMFTLARADADGYRLTRTPVYLDEIVDECVQAASVMARGRAIHVDVHLSFEETLTGDDALLRQLVMNLLDNAIRYTPAGGRVAVSTARDRDTAVILVADTGPGIPASERERVFERFVRLDEARSATSGAGLGLPIARWIAGQHHGSIDLQENSPSGCVFVVRLAIRAVSRPSSS